jgi:glutamate formiminotransferase
MEFEPRGSRRVSTVEPVVRGSEKLTEVDAKPSSALLFASRLVSKGVGVDGTRDRLVAFNLKVRCDVDVKKKVKGLRVAPASLSQTIRQDNVIFVARNKSKDPE